MTSAAIIDVLSESDSDEPLEILEVPETQGGNGYLLFCGSQALAQCARREGLVRYAKLFLRRDIHGEK